MHLVVRVESHTHDTRDRLFFRCNKPRIKQKPIPIYNSEQFHTFVNDFVDDFAGFSLKNLISRNDVLVDTFCKFFQKLPGSSHFLGYRYAAT